LLFAGPQQQASLFEHLPQCARWFERPGAAGWLSDPHWRVW